MHCLCSSASLGDTQLFCHGGQAEVLVQEFAPVITPFSTPGITPFSRPLPLPLSAPPCSYYFQHPPALTPFSTCAIGDFP